MGWVTGILVYAVIWWVVFFMLLPFGVRAQNESEDGIVPGSEESAPVAPRIGRKAMWCTVLSAIVWAIVYWLITSGDVDLTATAPQ